MKIKIVETDENIVTYGGNLLVGELLGKTALRERLNELEVTGNNGIKNADVAFSYIGTLTQGQPEFEAVEQFRDDDYFIKSMGISEIPSGPTLRQRLDAMGTEQKEQVLSIIQNEICKLLRTQNVQISPCYKDFVALDVDVTPFDNSKTKKEGLGFTYKKFMGFAPIMAYLGEEGYCVNVELREGQQHCQKGTPKFLEQAILNAKIVTDKPILVRLDSGNDSADNIKIMQAEESKVDFLFKRNPRREFLEDHWMAACDVGYEVEGLRDGKRCFIYEETMTYKDCKPVRMVHFVVERTSTPNGQGFLIPEYELESYTTSLFEETPEQLRELYHAHGTSEQFHSEIKTDLDLERLPSGKFATNEIVLTLGIFAYNILRIIGQESLREDDYPPTAHKVKRRRIRTVIQHYITLAAKFVMHAREFYLKISHHNPWRESFERMYFDLG